MKLEQIDKNFQAKKERNDGMTEYRMPCPMFDIYGVFYDEERKFFTRMDYAVSEKVNGGVHYLNRYTSGGRIRFRTNAKKMEITVKTRGLNRMSHMTLLGSCGFSLLEERERGEFLTGCFRPEFEDYYGFHASNDLSGEWKEYILYMPLYNDVIDLVISLDKEAKLEKPKGYRKEKPIMYYGSSITEGGCASRPDTSYTATIGKWNRIDFLNLGFSGSARGEVEMAEYLARQECSLFVCDYDHNSPSVEHLQATHYPLYEIFRKAQKDTPILFLTKPDVRSYASYKQFRDVVYATYKKAKANGDENVYFLDGKTYYNEKGWDICSVDGGHPNDLGFYMMAKKIYAKMCKINKKFQ